MKDEEMDNPQKATDKLPLTHNYHLGNSELQSKSQNVPITRHVKPDTSTSFLHLRKM